MSEQISMGAIQSPQDVRNIPSTALFASAEPLPSKFIHDVSALPVWHQHKIGACTGHAGGKLMQFLYYLKNKSIINFSARFPYATAKQRDGIADEGTYPSLIAKILYNDGCATENTIINDTLLSHEEYVYNRKQNGCPEEARKEALDYKISGYAFVDPTNLNDIKRAIVNSHGTMALLQVGSEWYTPSWLAKDILPIRPPKIVISGHEVFLYGYEDTPDGDTKLYIFNSWSDAWGDKGTGYLYWSQYKNYIKEIITFTDVPKEIIDILKLMPSKDKFKYTFTKTIKMGDTGNDVVALQTVLLYEGLFDKQLYISLLQKKELGFYGEVTRKALLAFQKKYKVASLAELLLPSLSGKSVGPKTIAMLNKLYAK